MDKQAEHKQGNLTRDPVCGMEVDVTVDKPSADYHGHDYHFCSKRCWNKFLSAPDDYLTATDCLTSAPMEQISGIAQERISGSS